MPKQEIVEHHTVCKVSSFCICCVFYFFCELLFAGNGVCFSFFMMVMVLGVDLTKFLCCVVLVMKGVRAWQYMSKFPIDKKLSSEI